MRTPPKNALKCTYKRTNNSQTPPKHPTNHPRPFLDPFRNFEKIGIFRVPKPPPVHLSNSTRNVQKTSKTTENERPTASKSHPRRANDTQTTHKHHHEHSASSRIQCHQQPYHKPRRQCHGVGDINHVLHVFVGQTCQPQTD